MTGFHARPVERKAAEPLAPDAQRGGDRALVLGPRLTAGGLAAAAAAVVVFAALALGLGAGRGGSSAQSGSRSARSAARYGGLPSWLPKPTVPVNRIVDANAAHPALAIQGDSISVDLVSGRVLATAVGPTVPEDGRFPVPATSPCTFIVTLAGASGTIPLSASAFTFVDELGHVRHPRVTALRGGAPPRRVLPGQTVSLKVYDVLPTGDGGLSWAPAGGRPIASWDFDVEID
jgi:hypothetical protein